MKPGIPPPPTGHIHASIEACALVVPVGDPHAPLTALMSDRAFLGPAPLLPYTEISRTYTIANISLFSEGFLLLIPPLPSDACYKYVWKVLTHVVLRGSIHA